MLSLWNIHRHALLPSNINLALIILQSLLLLLQLIQIVGVNVVQFDVYSYFKIGWPFVAVVCAWMTMICIIDLLVVVIVVIVLHHRAEIEHGGSGGGEAASSAAACLLFQDLLLH